MRQLGKGTGEQRTGKSETLKQRIQKIIADSGLYSRRAVERFIDEGKIKVNGVVVTTKGMKIHPSDRIQINGKAFQYSPMKRMVAFLLNKPRKVMVTRKDPEGRKTIYDLLPKNFQNLKPVGRLDYNSQGGIILTNSGDLILKLTHPRYHLEKIYEVKLSSRPDDKQLNRLRRGVLIDGVRTLPAQIDVIKNQKSSTLLQFVLQEGKNRQIRKMCKTVGLTVKELKRVAIGPVKLKGLRSGTCRSLTSSELKKIYKSL